MSPTGLAGVGEPRRRASGNPWIRRRGSEWVIIQRGTGRVLSRHSSREKAEASFRAMERSKHHR